MDHGSSSAYQGRVYRIPQVNFKDPNAGLLKKARMAAHAVYSLSARGAMRHCLAEFRPDLAHIRGIYHHLSPSILWELKRRRVPVLYHLNDFKMLCPSYNLVAHGEACQACRNGAFYHVVSGRCYEGPASSVLVLAAEAYVHKWLRTYERCVDLFLAPCEFVRAELIANGFPAGRIEVLPHYQELPGEDEIAADEGYLLYFGRLSPEKGVGELLHALARLPHIPVVIAGDGPERERLQALARELHLGNVCFSGHVTGKKLQTLIARCRFSLFPSHAYETLGKSILESYAYARPVIASDLGSRRELVENGVTGLLYSPGDRKQLAHCIRFLFDRPDLIARMGTAARARLVARHDPEEHLQKLLAIYSRLRLAKRLAPLSAEPQACPRRSVRVAFIGGRGVVSKYSGIESYYEQVGRELACLGHDVTVYCRTYFTPPMATHNGMRIRRLPTIRTKHLETAVHTLLSTLDAMASDCDIVHYHCLGPALFSFLPRLVGKKTVVTIQGLDWQRAKWGALAARILRWGEYAAVTLPHASMVVSRTLQNYYLDRYRRDTIYVPNGGVPSRRDGCSRLARWNLLPDDYILFLGRLSPEKNCHLLIDAFEKIQTGMKLVLAGGSSHTDTYIESLRNHASDRIRFLPWVSGSDLDELLANAALFVLPSELEGLSLALLDAMASGVCVLASDIPENREAVEGAGFTFQRGNRQDLARMLDLLVREPALRRHAAARERSRAEEHYGWPPIARRIEEVYYNVLGWSVREREPHAEFDASCSEVPTQVSD